MKYVSESKRFIGFKAADANEFLSELKEGIGMKLLWLKLKGDDWADPVTFEPKKSEFYMAQFEVPQ